MSYPKIFFLQNLHFGPIRWFPRWFLKILIIYCQNLHFNFIAHWAYEERISAYAQPAVKCEQFLHVQYNQRSAYAERTLSHTEHTGNEFHRMLSIRGTDFIACWACAEMFKSRISRPHRIWCSKISCYRPLGPYGFGFCKKSQKKFHAWVTLILAGQVKKKKTSGREQSRVDFVIIHLKK